MTPRTLVVGIGSPHGDDQLGWRIAQRLAASCDTRCAATPAELLGELPIAAERLELVDACADLPPQAAFCVWSLDQFLAHPVTRSALSSHLISLPATLRLAAELNVLPPRVRVWGVRGERFDAASDLSDSARAACELATFELARELGVTLDA